MPHSDGQVPVCDNEVVAALIENDLGQILTFKRTKHPSGRAPAGVGHRDQHGPWRDALGQEVYEETGLTVVTAQVVYVEWIPNRCRRHLGPLGAGHTWTVFRCRCAGTENIDPSEGVDPQWLYPAEFARLARSTVDYGQGRISEQGWREDPGLEPVWAFLLSGPGVDGWRMLHLADEERQLMLHLAKGGQPTIAV